MNLAWFIICLAVPFAGQAEEKFSTQRAQVLALGQLTISPVSQIAERHASTTNLKAIYYDALP